MPVRLDSLAAALDHGFDALIDVRSPAEFAEDRIPGAINLPALSNEERATVGTIYVQDSAFRARKIGAALVARNVASHLEGPLAGMDGGWRPLVYCWRGGQRSGSVATILKAVGWRADTVEGGYQSWRRRVVAETYEAPPASRVVLIDGNTGTAKTEVLQRLAAAGHQAIDLEGLAHHRGSLFGGRGGQPAQKGFDSAVAAALGRLDPGRPVFVEAESSKIGDLLIPPGLFAAMRDAPRIEIAAPPEARAAYLVRAYADIVADGARLDEVLGRLRRIQGAERVAAWQEMARAGAFEALALDLVHRHYDPRYAKSRSRSEGRIAARVTTDRLEDADLDRLADEIAARAAAPGPAA